MDQRKPKLEYNLHNKGMGVVERAGLAGLYLTLQGADEWAKDKGTDTGKNARELKALFRAWDLSQPDLLQLNWDAGGDLKPLTALVQWAWQVHEGVFFLPGIHRSLVERNNRHLRVAVHNGILATFLQHNRVRPKLSLPKNEDDAGLVIQLDVGKTIEIPRFPEIPAYYNDKTGKRKKNLLKQSEHLIPKGKTRILPFEPGRIVDLSGAFYPGVAPRYGTDKRWTGTPEEAFLLFFVPIGCLFLELPRNRVILKAGKEVFSPNWAVVIPDIVDLLDYAEAWPRLHPALQERFDKLKCRSVDDALLRVAMEYSVLPAVKRAVRFGGSPTIHVFCMGRTSFQRKANKLSEIQMVRKQVLSVGFTSTAVNRYKKVMAFLDNRLDPYKDKTSHPATHWIKELYGRGRIADNISKGKPWYMDLCVPTEWERDGLERERQRYNETRSDEQDRLSEQEFWFMKVREKSVKEALMALAKDMSMYDDPETETVFLQAIHDMLATLFWQEREALIKRLGLNEENPKFKEKLSKRIEDLVDDFRRSLNEAQTRELLRQTLAEWLSKGGTHENIRAHQRGIWDFINHPHQWKKAKDLALLGIVTYEAKRKPGQS